MMRNCNRHATVARGGLLFAATLALLLAACSPKSASVRFKVNSEPEGAHVLYQASGKDLPCGGKWIYLGNTPLRGVHQFNERQLEQTEKITMKVMHNGYHEQKIEWDGPSFWEEVEGRGVIFWTPELIPVSGP
ncbi:hypothetical protein [Desulfogranum mediterraneum]|uniref:hypothetical protein n=1 Tax=Desulfogranum mediterraneum TaxID=160661 RepID=UPI0003F8918F|nr:hypothetical protein [Desulfogranum mediterraneum]